MMASRKARGIYTGFAKRLDEPDLYDLAIERSTDVRKAGHSSVAASITHDMIEKSRNAHSMLIPPRFRVGTKVLFRLDIDNQWMPADRLRGRIIQRFHNHIWFYVIQDSDGKRYSIPHYKVIMRIKDELMVVPQPITAIIKLEQPATMAGEQAA